MLKTNVHLGGVCGLRLLDVHGDFLFGRRVSCRQAVECCEQFRPLGFGPGSPIAILRDMARDCAHCLRLSLLHRIDLRAMQRDGPTTNWTWSLITKNMTHPNLHTYIKQGLIGQVPKLPQSLFDCLDKNKVLYWIGRKLVDQYSSDYSYKVSLVVLRTTIKLY